MPSDANGNYSLPNGYLATTGQQILASQHNPPLEDLGLSMSQRLMRTGVAPMTGPLKFTDGDVTAPGITFNNSTNTGFYRTATGVALAVGGAKVAEFTANGMSTGARYIGELIPFIGSTAQPLTVLPVGQTLSRAGYPGLWTLAQTEIAAGNPFFNNGDGSTTFGIGDMRGRGFRAIDNMGGSAAGRITTTQFGASVTQVGTAGGAASTTLARSDLPNTNVAVTITDLGHSHTTATVLEGTGFGAFNVYAPSGNAGASNPPTNSATTGISAAFNLNGNVTQTLLSRLSPSVLGNWLLFAGA